MHMATQDYTGIKVYQGNEPYIFVSYAHKDSDKVVPVIIKLQQLGFRVWFDLGIEAGTEWSNNIAAHLKDCNAFLFFTSHNSAVSENCLDEVAYAKAYNKSSLMVFLEDEVALPQGAEMQTARFQRIYYTRHKTLDSFAAALAEAPLLQICRDQQDGQAAPVAQPQPPVSKAKPAPNKKKLIIIAAAVAAALLAGILCFVFLGGSQEADVPTEAGTYYLSSITYEGITLMPEEMDMDPTENYVVLNGDGTGYMVEENTKVDISYDDSALRLLDGDEEYTFDMKIVDDKLQLEAEEAVLSFTKEES